MLIRVEVTTSSRRGASEPIRPRLHDWLPRIGRSSLASVVGATVGFGARYTTDVFAEDDARFAAECAAMEEAEYSCKHAA